MRFGVLEFILFQTILTILKSGIHGIRGTDYFKTNHLFLKSVLDPSKWDLPYATQEIGMELKP